MERPPVTTTAPTRVTNHPTNTGPKGTADAYKSMPMGKPITVAKVIAVGVRQALDTGLFVPLVIATYQAKVPGPLALHSIHLFPRRERIISVLRRLILPIAVLVILTPFFLWWLLRQPSPIATIQVS